MHFNLLFRYKNVTFVIIKSASMKKLLLIFLSLFFVVFIFSNRVNAQTNEKIDTTKKVEAVKSEEAVESAPLNIEKSESPESPESPYNMKSEPVPNAEIFIEQNNSQPIKQNKKETKQNNDPLKKEDPKK
jgi:hypothetical protein